MTNRKSAARMFDLLATLHLASGAASQGSHSGNRLQPELRRIAEMTDAQFDELLAFAELQRVQIRTLTIIANAWGPLHGGRDAVEQRLSRQLSQVKNAIVQWSNIVGALEEQGIAIMVIKTLDHWPDIGSDLDLFTMASAGEVCHVMTSVLGAETLPQSWGDKLACKWNFRVPGLSVPVEVHVKRLGQTGEQCTLPQQLFESRIRREVHGQFFRVPSPEHQIAIVALQRMYRHFYIRLTDIVNVARLLRSSALDLERLREITEPVALWPGIATLLQIVSGYSEHYGGTPLALPAEVRDAACFTEGSTYVDQSFLRIPMVPQATGLYCRQWGKTAASRNFRSLSRLTLLPFLAAAAMVNFRLTGNDKGIW